LKDPDPLRRPDQTDPVEHGEDSEGFDYLADPRHAKGNLRPGIDLNDRRQPFEVGETGAPRVSRPKRVARSSGD
jgi:hypothetical protein